MEYPVNRESRIDNSTEKIIRIEGTWHRKMVSPWDVAGLGEASAPAEEKRLRWVRILLSSAREGGRESGQGGLRDMGLMVNEGRET